MPTRILAGAADATQTAESLMSENQTSVPDVAAAVSYQQTTHCSIVFAGGAAAKATRLCII